MLRGVLKLGQAWRAYRRGRIEEALALAEDPLVRDHLRAKKLREKCLEALRRRATKHEKKGDLGLAVEEMRVVDRHEPTASVKARRAELEARAKDDKETADRWRGLRARAEYEMRHGRLDEARDLVASCDPKQRAEHLESLERQIDESIRSARDLAVKARQEVGRDDKEAEDLLRRAARLHPSAKAVREAAHALIAARVKKALAGKLSDGALAAFTVEHHRLKDRFSSVLDAASIETMDQPLADELERRIRRRLADGEGLEAARLLADRRHENLAPSQSGREIRAGLLDLVQARDAIELGDFDDARRLAESARKRFGRVPSVKELDRDVARREASVRPAFDKAGVCFKQGDFERTRALLSEVLSEAPRHRAARQMLEAVDGRLGGVEKSLARARAMVGEGRLSEAREALLRIDVGAGRPAEVSVLLTDIDRRQREADRTARRLTRVACGEAVTDDDLVRAETELREARVLDPSSSRLFEAAKELRAARATMPETSSRPTPSFVSSGGPVGTPWLLSVEEHGEYLVLEDDELVIGNAVKREADVPILARIGSRHARIMRRSSFHGGVSYRLEALEGQLVRIGDEAVEMHELHDGDHVRLGVDFGFVFRCPSRRSCAAVLELDGDFEVEGTRRLLLMPPTGSVAALLVGTSSDSHVVVSADCEFEIYRDGGRDGALVCESPSGVAVAGDEARARSELHDGVAFACGDLGGAVRTVSLG